MLKSRTTTERSALLAVNLPPIPPGDHLRDELDAMGISINAFSRALDVPSNRITAILKGKRAITADTALRLSCYFGTTAEFWMNLQQSYDLAVLKRERGDVIVNSVRPFAA
ncbi:MAG: addiction module antidote protein, HigA family [Alphaproteobacteria bacterium RIFOXYD12_FULL_60_8]|nr:MAG: addiction module antidote protein, HigA family [Alphaproteobacteria bacterium RIFOXYD12_FULL_60_8]